MSSLLSVLWLVDIAFMVYSIESILMEGPTVMIMFASEVSLVVKFSCRTEYMGLTIFSPIPVYDSARGSVELYDEVCYQYCRCEVGAELGG